MLINFVKSGINFSFDLNSKTVNFSIERISKDIAQLNLPPMTKPTQLVDISFMKKVIQTSHPNIEEATLISVRFAISLSTLRLSINGQ